jgi:hypothetical protein
MDLVANTAERNGASSAEQPLGVSYDRVEHGLSVGRRAGNYLQDLARRRLLLERLAHPGVRFGERRVLLVKLGQQAGVLDRNHCLIGKGLEERDLVVSEPAGFAARYRDRANRFVVTKHRDDDLTVIPERARVRTDSFMDARIGLCVGNVEGHASADGVGVRGSGMHRMGEERAQRGVRRVVIAARQRGEHDLIAVDPGQRARVRAKQADGALHNRVEDRLDIRLGAADDAQDVAGGGLRVQRRGQLAVARLELGEQPHVLDRDHRLVGEGLEESGLPRSEEMNLSAPDEDDANRDAFSRQGDRKHSPVAEPAR